MSERTSPRAPRRGLMLAVPGGLAVVALLALVFASTGSSVNSNLFKTQHGKFANGKTIPHPSGGTEVAWDEERQEAADAQSGTAAASDLPPDATASAVGCSNRGSVTNPRVNQDCTLRRQAEEQIAVNPIDPSNIIAGQNDSRIGYNHCAFDYSLNGGTSWGDGIPPYYQHTNPGTGHTYDAASDPTVTFTGDGTAWFSCILFDINSNASALFVNPSTAALKGSAYANIPNRPSPYVVAEANDPGVFYDKQFIAGDSNGTSVYVTFTRFLADQKCSNGNNPGAYCSSEIWYSKWNGTSWSAPANLSGSNPVLCDFGNTFDKKADPHACNFNQGSMPVVTSDHGAFVVWNNGNTATLLNQQLGRRINADGTLGPVVKVGQDEESNLALCDFGRGPEECVKSLNIRTNDFPALAVDPRNANHLVSVWQDSRNVAPGSGAYRVVVSESRDGGATWSDVTGAGATISGAAGEALFEPSVAITKGGRVAVSYYKANAYTGADVGGGTFGYYVAYKSGATSWAQSRVSDSGTLPSPQANSAQRGFLGDYSSIAASTTADSNLVYPIWSDTRNSSSAGPDEDIFTARFTVPIP